MRKDELRVLVVSRLYPRASDPVLGIFVEEEVRQLSKRCQTKVLSPVPWFPRFKLFEKWYSYTEIPDHESRGGIEVFRPRTIMLPRNLLFSLLGFSFYLPLLRAARDIDRSLPLDLIHAHTAYPDGFAAVRVGRALKLPVVVTLHGGDVNVHFRRYLCRRLGLWALSRADRVIAVSESLRRKVVEEYGTSAAKVAVIPNGVDVAKFQPMTRAEALKGLELDSHAARVLYVGAINESKGIRYLLKAANRVTESLHRAIEFVLIGEGEYEEAARTLTSELGIASAVNFVGKRPNSEIPLWINASDLLVLPSLSEGFGVALIEAMACGKPVVATRCGGPDDIVRPDTGILVPPGDEAALAKALREILSGERHFDPQRVRQRALDNYAYDGVVSRILEVYRQAL